jgi:Pyruvate/2-oxoacid:ferredoxin oxidoreductase delta subunit
MVKKITGTAVAIGGGLAAGFGLLKKQSRRYPVISGKYSHEGVRLIRPPGAVDEVDPSVKACTLCMKCTTVCPTGVLRPMKLEEKAEVDMATVKLREDLCISYKAKRLRDEQAMLMALGQSPTQATERPQQRGPCGECYMFCPLRRHAIKLEPGAFLAPIVFLDECVGCGLCEEICRVIVHGEPAIRVVPKRGTV